MNFWKIFYALGAAAGVFYGFMYWFEALPADNITLAFYAWGFACMCAAEVLGKERH